MVVVHWWDFQARTVALARVLHGEAKFIWGGRLHAHGALLPFRYVGDGAKTWRFLRQANPKVVVAVTPPVFTPLVCWLWCTLHRRRLVVDCHTTAFHSRKWGWARPLHRFLLRRAAAVLLHTEDAEREVAGWGAPALLLPDDVPSQSQAARLTQAATPQVLVAGSLDSGEPVETVLQAAALLPAVTFLVTGHLGRVSSSMRRAAPANVHFTGFLDYSTFLGQMLVADVVAVFSTDPHIMNRAAFEAVGLGRALVLSDLPGLRARFGSAALFAANQPEDIRAAITQALSQKGALEDRSRQLKSTLSQQYEAGLARLAMLLTPPSKPSRLPRRILLVSQHRYPAAPLLRRNVEHLVRQGVEVDLVCTSRARGVPVEQRLPGLRIFGIPVKHRRHWRGAYLYEYISFFLLAIPLVCALGLRHRYETVQVDNMPDHLAFVAFIPRLRGARLVLYIYDVVPEITMTRLHIGSHHWVIRLARLLENLAAQWVDHVITVSDCYVRLLVSHGVDRSKVSVVFNSQTLPSDVQRTPTSAPLLVTHTSLIERYGVQVVIQALPALLASWPDLRYEVYGEGEYLHTLERLAASIGVSAHVTFAGFVPSWNDLMHRIARATVGVVPVIPDGYGELILPMKLLEYVEIGIPVVCSRLPGIEEHFPPKSLAYFAPGDSAALAAEVDCLLRHPVESREQAARAQLALESLRWETVAPSYLAALAPA